MSTGLWATVAAVVGLVLTFLLGRGTGKLKASEKEAEAAKREMEKAKVEERNAQAKAASADVKADMAVKIFDVVTDYVPYTQQTEPLRQMEQEVKESTPEQDPEALALEIARRQAAQAKAFIEEHR